jgi:hypothetical protein
MICPRQPVLLSGKPDAQPSLTFQQRFAWEPDGEVTAVLLALVLVLCSWCPSRQASPSASPAQRPAKRNRYFVVHLPTAGQRCWDHIRVTADRQFPAETRDATANCSFDRRVEWSGRGSEIYDKVHLCCWWNRPV